MKELTITIIEENDYESIYNYKNYEGKIIIVNPDSFKDSYKDPKFLVGVACGGFGCVTSNLGNCVMTTFCNDGECARVERYNLLGIATDEFVNEWKKKYGDFHPQAIEALEKHKNNWEREER